MSIRKIAGRVLPYVGLSIAFFFVLSLYDAGANAKYHARNSACRSNLRIIGKQIALHRKSHNGQMPIGFMQLKYRYKSLFLCPLVSSEKKSDGKYTSYTYIYRRLKAPGPTDIICWDRKPHIPERAIFVSENTPRRNVLLANGEVKMIREKEFQAYQLTGNTEAIDAYTNKWITSNE